ncbi:helix-turn-helix domain-containing protein [Paenibacillus sp. MAH-36]|uniref:Helix-turn-helix transcriptional regulator n=1 Tax=Paenibacillus violae TaxID=3077234 RepID=A0ABU3R7X0_9BACL|nr:helix-turn-helix transcriptional regulator [Paenibacillus sp. PFR10]MDU0200178.1 helix-turn-helix transcriptional regulator [Paenibacillus sp. PFR10]
MKLKVDQLMQARNMNVKQLSELTGIRWNTVDDYSKNKAKHWMPVHLEAFMKVFELEAIEQLIEWVE